MTAALRVLLVFLTASPALVPQQAQTPNPEFRLINSASVTNSRLRGTSPSLLYVILGWRSSGYKRVLKNVELISANQPRSERGLPEICVVRNQWMF